MKRIPNIISATRLGMAIALLWTADRPRLFVTVYLLCGISDAVDGFLARKYHVESRLGAKLDSLADFSFFCTSLVVLVFLRGMRPDAARWSIVFSVTFVKLVNFIITRVKFKEWNIMHTYANKAAGLVIFSSVPVFMVQGEFGMWTVWTVAAALTLAAAEEMLILLTSKEYDVNCKGLRQHRAAKKAG